MRRQVERRPWQTAARSDLAATWPCLYYRVVGLEEQGERGP